MPVPLNMHEPKNINARKVRDRFAINLRIAMDDKKITIRKLASITGVSVSAIVSYRASKKDAAITRIVSLAKGIGVPASTLLEGL